MGSAYTYQLEPEPESEREQSPYTDPINSSVRTTIGSLQHGCHNTIET